MAIRRRLTSNATFLYPDHRWFAVKTGGEHAKEIVISGAGPSMLDTMRKSPWAVPGAAEVDSLLLSLDVFKPDRRPALVVSSDNNTEQAGKEPPL